MTHAVPPQAAAPPPPAGGPPSAREGRSDPVVVIGGGVVGTAALYELARAGLPALLLERRGLAAEASGANVALLNVSAKPPGPLLELGKAGAARYRELPAELAADLHYRRTGALHVARDEAGLARVRARAELLRRHALHAEWVEPADAARMEPALTRDLHAALWVADDAVVYPFAVVAAYARAARRLGARVETGGGAEVTGIAVQGHRVRGVHTRAGRRAARAVVLAAGAWSARLVGDLGIPLPLEPVRGQVLATRRAPPLIHRVVIGPRPFVRQTRYGNVIIGSTLERAGFDKRVTPETGRAFARSALDWFPGIRGLQVIRAWAGLRSATPDELPVLGSAPGVEGLFFATGHFRHGLLTAPASGRMVAAMVRDPAGWRRRWPWAEAFAPARFAAGGGDA